MLEPGAWVPLAQVARPHGVRGELRLRPFNRDSDLLLAQGEVLVRLPDGEEHEVSVDGARRAGDAILMKLFSIDDRDRADGLRGAVVCVRRGQLPALSEGEFYVCDVQGARVVVDANVLGRVRELKAYPSVDVLVVEAADGGPTYEVPLVDSVVRSVDVEGGVVVLSGLDGVERG